LLPIERDKSNARVEYGAKLSISHRRGYAFLDVLSWDPFHKGTRFRDSVEKYKERHGYYPEAVLVDTIYRTRERRKFCKERGIRMSDTKIGRPSNNEQVNVDQQRVESHEAHD